MKAFVLAFLILFSPCAFALDIGATAPDFSVKASNGKVVRLSDYTGKIVVLEWLNYGCPFDQKHYKSHQMQDLQKKYTAKGVTWLSVISSAPGKQGYSDPAKAEVDYKEHDSHATAVLLDSDGTIGKKLYGAQTTPHIFIVDAKGKLAYQGAADSIPSTDVEDIKKAKSYIQESLDALLAGKKVPEAQTKSYGCSVKYGA